MAINYHSVVIFVSDIEKAKEFYTKCLDLKIDMDMGTNILLEGGISLWKIRENHSIPDIIGLDRIKNKNNNFELYFETIDINSVCEKLKKNSVRFLHEIHEESWGQKTIRFFDPDENIIEIGESLQIFINRMYNNGLSADEISNKTGMMKKDIEKILV